MEASELWRAADHLWSYVSEFGECTNKKIIDAMRGQLVQVTLLYVQQNAESPTLESEIKPVADVLGRVHDWMVAHKHAQE